MKLLAFVAWVVGKRAGVAHDDGDASSFSVNGWAEAHPRWGTALAGAGGTKMKCVLS